MRIVTRGFGTDHRIVTRGYGYAVGEAIRRELLELDSPVNFTIELISNTKSGCTW